MRNQNPFVDPFLPRSVEQQNIGANESQRLLLFTSNSGQLTNPFVEPVVPRSIEERRIDVDESQWSLFFTSNSGSPLTNHFIRPVVPRSIEQRRIGTGESQRSLFNTFNSGFSHTNHLIRPVVPWSIEQRSIGADESQRSLFFTFDSGFPLTKEEINHFFTRWLGPSSVQYVYVHEQGNRIPEFGKIVFNSSDLPRWIMRNFEVVRVCVTGKSLWLKKYVSRSQRNANVNQN